MGRFLISTKEKINNVYEKHSEIIIILLLALVFYFIFFSGIGNYYLMDVDETRYVAMARDMFLSKDYSTLYLNGEFFFEKPPLYFWIECLSFKLFGTVNEFSARFPVSMLGCCFSFFVYFSVKRWINRKVAVFSALILSTSLFFIIMAKYAILDIVLFFFSALAVLSYFNTFFCEEKNKKYFWWLLYIFSALAVMAKGIPGFVVPFGIVFFVSLFTKSFKEIFKWQYFVIGVLLFLLIVLPWHIYMLKTYNPLFFNEYIVKHHIERFVNSNEIGRKQPFFYYIFILLWGSIPWVFSAIAALVTEIKKWWEEKSFLHRSRFEEFDNSQKLTFLLKISFLWILLFFSISSTKLATYILPLYYPIAMIMGLVWADYTDGKKYVKPIDISVIIYGYIILFAGFCALFSPLFLSAEIFEIIRKLWLFASVLFIVFGFTTLLLLKYRQRKWIFVVYVIFMAIISAFGTDKVYNTDYKFGQKELVEFAKYAKKHDYTISANAMNRKYSLIFYNDELVDYNTPDADVKVVEQDLKKSKNVVILKKDNFNKIKDKLKYKILKKGKRYILIKGL